MLRHIDPVAPFRHPTWSAPAKQTKAAISWRGISTTMQTQNNLEVAGKGATEIVSRRIVGHQTQLLLSDGTAHMARRFFPAGQGDSLRRTASGLEVLARQDDAWVTIEPAWRCEGSVELGPQTIPLVFKEIETVEELARYESLRKFHYRGGGGAGRTVSLIATSQLWDLPSVLGFVEISSSMIANTARKRFLDAPYSEESGLHWQQWDSASSKKYSNALCRVSRFVIHPEIRGLGVAKEFLEAARKYALERWHYGGLRPRFLEITADMLKYYKFVDEPFAPMGETQGNEHRLTKDMNYLVKRALSEETGRKGMPAGGGGIMTLQRGYASQLLRYVERNGKQVQEAIDSLRFEPAQLDQETWESLHRLNRRPKVSYISGLTPEAKAYVERRRVMLAATPQPAKSSERSGKARTALRLKDVSITASVNISQTTEARHLQDAFGFVGANLRAELVQELSFELRPTALTLVCGASGSGKSILMRACTDLLRGEPTAAATTGSTLEIQGAASRRAIVAELTDPPLDATPLELRGRASLEDFLKVTAKCGLAEPQLFVRPIQSLSSGQRYRLSVALAFLTKPDVVAIDNFCEPLDRFTTLAVIRGIKHLAAEFGVSVLAATAAYDRLHELSDVDQIILLRRGDAAVVTTPTGHDELQEGFHG
jgi:ABC-type ATPase with predicted acetyltransferase domain